MARPGGEGPTDRPDESESLETPHARSLESRRRSSLVFPGDETHADKQIDSPEDFVEWIKDNAEFTFTLMIHRQEKWEQREQEIKEMENAHKEEVFNLNERIMRLTQQIPRENEDGDSRMEAEYAQMRDELDQAQKEKESLLAVVKMMGGGAPTVKGNHQSPAQKRSAKMPDPPVLSDGKGVKFKPWRAEMQRKLLLNDDHYPTTAHQLAYVSSRCEGKAYGHISPRMEDNSTTPYQTIKDVFDHLESVFYDPNQKQVARDEYLDLKMDAKQDFIDFLADFTRLAEESEQPMDLRKKDLYRKLPSLLQTQVMIHSGDKSVSLEQFIHKCQIASRLIAQQVAARNATRNTNRNNNSGTAGRGEASRSTSTNNEITRLTDAEKATLMKERKCFICREQGHVSYNCPKKTNKNERTAVASATVTGAKAKTKTKDEIEEAETDADSGNE
ncbi:uncharacterized protein N7515_001879 [Penicillium bovifimosum]|uniref:CCHC-type domain-containing protein n=1 Tax=Penicillium bovifimosum TaxID=126998 RepID=A0A9W9HAI7_9EURO|nr:uncharacterized protein N7515_001879 [Penicillium bovifimosum]KAJ5143092.1 hypothetical protein N7515_001879 [Penicillium bovifimosum]